MELSFILLFVARKVMHGKNKNIMGLGKLSLIDIKNVT